MRNVVAFRGSFWHQPLLIFIPVFLAFVLTDGQFIRAGTLFEEKNKINKICNEYQIQHAKTVQFLLTYGETT
jgi:hypothetical protein